MTPVDTVRKENIWHPLKNLKNLHDRFKPVIYVCLINKYLIYFNLRLMILN